MKAKDIKIVLGFITGLVLLNILATLVYGRFDLTKNKQYTLSEPTKEIIESLDKPIYISVFLKGDFPSNFKRLQNETRYLLEDLRAENSNIRFRFYNPLETNNASAEEIGQGFFESGMPPQRLNVKKNGKDSQSLVFPWAVVTQGEKSVNIPLLKMNPEDDEEDLTRNSIQNLEYTFADGLKKLNAKKEKKIAVLRSNGELPDINIAGFLKAVGSYYHIAPFSLENAEDNPEKVLEELNDFDLIVEAKPTKAFSENEKYILDQYIMNGGKSLWLTEVVHAEKDSIFKGNKRELLALPVDLNLSDFFFKYGVRILPALINDLHADNIILASGAGKETQFKPYPWFYTPLVVSESKHPIVNNISPVRFDFANPMDTLKNEVKKTILLQSSIATKVEGTPRGIQLRNIIGKEPDFKTYSNGPQNLAVLLEGEFTSVYKNRIKPFEFSGSKDKSKPTKMIVVSDGDVIKNEVEKGQPTSLEYNPKTGKSYGNQEFLLNAVNYMLDDTGILDIRTKKVDIAFLDSEKVKENRLFWQLINLLLPLSLLLSCGFLFNFYRKRKYRKPL